MFDRDLWLLHFEFCVSYTTQRHLQVEDFSKIKRAKLLAGKGDRRELMAHHVVKLWNDLKARQVGEGDERHDETADDILWVIHSPPLFPLLPHPPCFFFPFPSSVFHFSPQADFLPDLVGAFQKMALVPRKAVRQIVIPCFFDMIEEEVAKQGDIAEVRKRK